MTTRIPLFLLGGFLGSGKTTLLRTMIRQPAFSRTAVIVNEFGAVGIDDALIARGSEDNVVLLDSGCICCALTSSLEETLESLYYQRERGEIPTFERVVVETTGLADPGPIASSLTGGLFTRRFFALAAINIAVDLAQGHQQLRDHDEARRQVALADRLILTKGDVASPADIAATTAAVVALNPHAPREIARHGQVGDLVWQAAADDAAPDDAAAHIEPATRERRAASGLPRRPSRPSRSPRLASVCPDCLAGRPHRHGLRLRPTKVAAVDEDPATDEAAAHDEAAQDAGAGLHGHGYAHAVVDIPGPLRWDDYARWVAALPRLAGPRLLRVKGWLNIEGWRTIQGVGTLFSAPEPTDRPPPDTAGGVLVLIGRHASPAELTAWAAPLVQAATTPSTTGTNPASGQAGPGTVDTD